MTILKIILGAIILLAGTANLAAQQIDPEKIKEVRLYYVPWSTRMDHRASPERIRQQCGYKLCFSNPWDIATFLSKLPTKPIEPFNGFWPDIRLVIDIVPRKGRIITFNVSKFYFFDKTLRYFSKPPQGFFDMFNLEQLDLFISAAPNQ